MQEALQDGVGNVSSTFQAMGGQMTLGDEPPPTPFRAGPRRSDYNDASHL